MFTLPNNSKGVVEYLRVRSGGSANPEDERVFLKAKGVLFLDEQEQESSRDRMWSFALGLAVGFLTAIAVPSSRECCVFN